MYCCFSELKYMSPLHLTPEIIPEITNLTLKLIDMSYKSTTWPCGQKSRLHWTHFYTWNSIMSTFAKFSKRDKIKNIDYLTLWSKVEVTVTLYLYATLPLQHELNQGSSFREKILNLFLLEPYAKISSCSGCYLGSPIEKKPNIW